jgi:hypothetical protein
MFARRFSPLPLRLLLALAVLAGPTVARAQGGAAGVKADAGQRAAMLAERQRLRVELERANAEIDALKRANRSLRDDYKLRARLADAEALARRLTELDTRLGGGGTPSRQGWTAPGAEPHGLPSDGPAELEAKADILADQARKLSARGDVLLTRARDLRARQNLRRRVGQMERDPFSPLEGSKRRTMAAGTVTSAAPGKTVTPTVGVGGTERSPGGGNGASSPAVSQDTTQTPPPSATPPTGSGFTSAPGASAPGPTSVSPAPPSTPAPAGGLAVTSPKTAPTPAAPVSFGESTALSAQLRDLLDPATLAELQRLEATSGTVTGVEALERAGAALKARAERLDREAAALRAARKH